MYFFQIIFWPITWVIKKIMNGLNNLLSKKSKENEIDEDEIQKEQNNNNRSYVFTNYQLFNNEDEVMLRVLAFYSELKKCIRK